MHHLGVPCGPWPRGCRGTLGYLGPGPLLGISIGAPRAGNEPYRSLGNPWAQGGQGVGARSLGELGGAPPNLFRICAGSSESLLNAAIIAAKVLFLFVSSFIKCRCMSLLLYASDSDPDVGPRRQPKKKQRNIRANDLEDLLQRQCVCNRRVCYTQFASDAVQICGARDRFNKLDSTSKNSFIRQALNMCSSSAEAEVARVVGHSDDADNELIYESGDEDLLLASDSEPENELLYASDDEPCQSSREATRSYAPNRQDSFRFLGKPVCRRAYERLLGVGGTTIRRIKDGEDAYTNKSRMKQPKHPTFGFTLDRPGKWMGILFYFFYLYHSAAEHLPTTFHMPRQDQELGASTTDPDQAHRMVNKFMQKLSVYQHDPEAQNIGPSTFDGPKRHVQHTSRTDLYYEYVGYIKSRGEDAASYVHFLRVANKVIGPYVRNTQLGVRAHLEHGECDDCFMHKLAIRQAKTAAEKEQAYRLYSHHILSQWLCRQHYWAAKTRSATFVKMMVSFGERQAGLSKARHVFQRPFKGLLEGLLKATLESLKE